MPSQPAPWQAHIIYSCHVHRWNRRNRVSQGLRERRGVCGLHSRQSHSQNEVVRRGIPYIRCHHGQLLHSSHSPDHGVTAGCRNCCNLPAPYSPDYNPIELVFSYVKAYLKHHDELLQALPDPLPVIKAAFESVTPEQCQSWITHAGYV